MEYELRKVNGLDIFIVTTIISKIGIRQFKSCLSGAETQSLIASFSNKSEEDNSGSLLASIGISAAIDIVGIIFENIAKCQTEIFQLLSNLSGLKVKELETANGTEVFEMIVKVVQENSKDFIGVASRLFKLEK